MMDKFAENLAGGIRRFAMAGVGAVSVTIDKSKEIFSQLADKGEAAAANSQACCDELQKKLTEQLDAFTKKLKTDYESASFEQLTAKCMKLTPEQKAILIEKLTAEPDEEEEPTPVSEEESESACCEEEPACCPADEAAEEPADEPDCCGESPEAEPADAE